MIHQTHNFINNISSFFGSLLIVLFIVHLPVTISVTSNSHNQLKLVHVIFAHKLYAPLDAHTKYGFPDKLDYEYFLTNMHEMPNEAKMEMYNLGVFLRHRYNDFLGEIYYPEVLKMRTSEYFLSMISGLLVNAGLWPPAESQRWKEDLDWQPIPTEYEPLESDTLFLGTLCPHFLDEEKRTLTMDESIKNEVSIHEPFFKHVSEHYGEKIERPSDISMLYSCLESIASDKEANKSLPAWTEGIFPHGEMWNVTLLAYDLLSKTKSQKQLNGGIFLKKIIDDSTKVVNSNNTMVTNGNNNSRDFRFSMYSGEERNVIGLLQAMNLWWSPHLLDNGASVILELRYDESADQYGFEIYYYSGVDYNETIGLTLPGCKDFCPLNDFARILAGVLPIDEKLLCHARLSIDQDEKSSADRKHRRVYSTHLLVLSIGLLLSLSIAS